MGNSREIIPLEFKCTTCGKLEFGQSLDGGWWRDPEGWFFAEDADLWACSPDCARAAQTQQAGKALESSKPLHRLLANEADQIVQRFVAGSRSEKVAPPGATRADVIDHLWKFLRDLSTALDTGFSRKALSQTSREHGEQRALLDQGLQPLIREYGVLIDCILDLLSEQHQTPTLHEYRSLSRAMTTSIAEAVEAFMEVRGAEEKARAEQVDFERTRLKTTVQILPVGIFILDKVGAMLEINSAAEAIWGGSVAAQAASEWGMYRGWFPDTGRQLAAEDWAGYKALVDGEVVMGQEVDILTFDGIRKTIVSSAAPLRESDGSIAGAVVSVIDMTERRRQEQVQRFLLEVSRTLASSFEVIANLKTIGRLAVPTFVDWFEVDLLERGEFPSEPQIFEYVDPEKVPFLLTELRSYLQGQVRPVGLASVAGEKRTQFVVVH